MSVGLTRILGLEKNRNDLLIQLESGLAFREIKVEGGTPLNYSLNISPFFVCSKSPKQRLIHSWWQKTLFFTEYTFD